MLSARWISEVKTWVRLPPTEVSMLGQSPKQSDVFADVLTGNH